MCANISGNVKKSGSRLSMSIPIVFVALMGVSFQTYAVLPDTLPVRVTFYDFNRNSDFGSGTCGNSLGMVQDMVDNNRKPFLKTISCYNDHLNQWFKPSGGSSAVSIQLKTPGAVCYRIKTEPASGTAAHSLPILQTTLRILLSMIHCHLSLSTAPRNVSI